MDTDIAVVGTGPTGLATALALAHGGFRVALIGPTPPTPPAALPHGQQPLDTRTAALLESSVDMLKALGVWEAILPHAAPLKAIRIIDASGSLFRAPDVEFRASELGLDAFGYNIANSVLVDELYAKAAGSVAALYPANVERVEITPSRARFSVGQGAQICARLVAGADGRNSICRKAAGIAASEQAYGQAAIATSFSHRVPHRGVSIELHRKGGSVTTVPLSDPAASSVIWIDSTEEIEAVMRLDAEDFVAALQDRLEGLHGQVDEAGARAQFLIMRLAAETLAGHRTALVGEAAHILPPIGAQGLNLGLRDAATLADCVGEARKHGGDPGSDDVLSAYDRARKVDVLTRTFGIDLLSRSLLSGFLPLQAARGIVSHGLNVLPPLRRLVMRIGMMPPTELPSLMRPGAQ
jgi:2-octaprenyl-6-methoxyphenol hydroxylase